MTSETSTLATEIDIVRSSVTRTLGANLEKLVLTGTLAINGVGNTLANTLTGNGAANTLNGGAGNDTLNGGSGADTFWFTSTLNGATNVDRVSNFSAADDRFLLDDARFVGIGPLGGLAAGNFNLGAAAGDASDRVIYNSATGQLFFDADGSGAAAQVLFATVTAGTTITFDDIWIG